MFRYCVCVLCQDSNTIIKLVMGIMFLPFERSCLSLHLLSVPFLCHYEFMHPRISISQLEFQRRQSFLYCVLGQ